MLTLMPMWPEVGAQKRTVRTGIALDRAGGIRWGEQQPHDRGAVARERTGKAHRVRGRRGNVRGLPHRRGADSASPGQGTGMRAGHRGQQAARLRGHNLLHRLDPGLRRGVREREHHSGKRDAIGDAVVHSADHRCAVTKPVDHVRVPERPGAVERHRHQIPNQLLQGGLVTGPGKRDVVHVVLEREVRIVLPLRGTQRQPAFDDALKEPGVTVDQTTLGYLLDPFPVDRLIEQQHGVDHHQVRRAVHMEPSRVGA
jgi:hypothetical protein